MDSKEGDDSSSSGRENRQKPHTSRLSCTKYFDALWFCYSDKSHTAEFSIQTPNSKQEQNLKADSFESTAGPNGPFSLCNKSPFHQMEQYYRYGLFDNCSDKWSSLFDCLTLKTKRPDEVEKILQAREKSKPHIWTYRTVEEATENWWRMYHHFFENPHTKPKPDA